MTSQTPTYSIAELTGALEAVGLRAGDLVYLHVSLESLGQLEGCARPEDRWDLLLTTLRWVVGDSGTILVPTYTFSFCRGELYDPSCTPTHGGPWSSSAGFLEYFRQLPGAVRSFDPIHSVAGIGPRAEELLTSPAPTCFGPGSVHDSLRQAGGKICTIGVGLHEATFRHHVEELAGVPFRFKKLFTGYIREGENLRKVGWVYNVRILADNAFPDGHRLEQRARETGICQAARVGLGEVTAIGAQEFFDFTMKELAADPWCTARGSAGDPVELERLRVGGPMYNVNLPADASMEQMVDALWELPRDIVSEGYDAALRALATEVPMTIHEYPSGTECWSWIVPEKWTCHEAYLETLDGRRIFSCEDHTLHVVSYSLPFEGEVSRQELLEHLHVDPKLPDAVPFKFKYYERAWGLCCSQRTRDSLTEDRYRVVIRTDFSYSTLKVGEVVAPGESDDCIVFCAHLCHPHMVNDDLSGVVVGIDMMRALLQRRDLRYTYRFLIVPETIGSIAYLSRNEQIIPLMKGGLFLEMLGRNQPHALQLSFQGDTQFDRCFTQAMREIDPESWTGAFHTVIGNDERQFNGPGVRVPMLSLSRVRRPESPDWPYVGYHSDHDNRAALSLEALEGSREMVLHMIDTIEQDRMPLNRFKGEVFCSRYGVFIDWQTNPDGSRAFFDIMSLIDGTRSISRIAEICGVPFQAARQSIEELRRHDLIEYLP